MRITVAICTWNRAKLLDQTLVQMKQLRIPEGVTWELVVVNNNSTDNTDEVIAGHATELPIRRLLETKQGHSNARNCAIGAATGELLIWTDDDVLVDPEWLAAYASVAREFPAASIFGGEIEPWFAATPPAWLRQHIGDVNVGSAFAVRHAGTYGQAVTAGNHPYGANLAFRTDAIRKYPFNPALGRCGFGMRSGDETDVICRMLRDGLSGVWTPHAKVEHYIIPERMTASYVYRFAKGIAEGNEWQAIQSGDVSELRFPRWRLRRWSEAMARRAWNSRVKNRVWIDSLLEAAREHGALSAWREARRQRLQSRRDAVTCS